ncbi:hypothetical protein [Halosegnis sp.]|uniref:hypothetical protein n=1 Tax=Halosegnis sp. TaxID=2864959 RepID=UPI0035D406DB
MNATRKLAVAAVAGVLLTGVWAVAGGVVGYGTHVLATLFALAAPAVAFARRTWLALGALVWVSSFAGLAWTLGLPGGAFGHVVTGLAWCGATAWLALE